MTAADILDRVSMQLNDSARTRWTERMLLNYLTDAMRQTVLNRPDASARVVVMQLVRGEHRQRIPEGYVKLLKVVRNMGMDGATPGRPVLPTTREACDAAYGMLPDVYEADEVLQWAFVQQTPDFFWVYPLPGEDVHLELECAAGVPQLMALADVLPLSDIFAEPLREYVLYRAYSVNGASVIDAQRAQSHLQQYYLAIGNEKAARMLGDPYARTSDLAVQQ